MNYFQRFTTIKMTKNVRNILQYLWHKVLKVQSIERGIFILSLISNN